MKGIVVLALLTVLSLSAHKLWAQADSTRAPVDSASAVADTVVKRPEKALTEAERDSIRAARRQARQDTLAKQWPIPGRATRLSLLLPGLGQIYNAGLGRSDVTRGSKILNVAKVPIIYGLLGLTVFLAIDNDTKYGTFKQAYIDRVYNATNASVPGFVPRPDNFPNVSDNGLRQQRDFFRRNRDLAVFWALVTYTLNGIEAYVAAHLRGFDVSDNLSLRLSPALTPMAGSTEPTLGARLSLHFGR